MIIMRRLSLDIGYIYVVSCNKMGWSLPKIHKLGMNFMVCMIGGLAEMVPRRFEPDKKTLPPVFDLGISYLEINMYK